MCREIVLIVFHLLYNNLIKKLKVGKCEWDKKKKNLLTNETHEKKI